MEDPRDGLTLFGPIESNLPYGIMSGVIGTTDGLKKFKNFVKKLQSPIYNSNNNTRPFYPGFETIFKAKWDPEKIVFCEVNELEISKHLYNEDTHTRTFELVTLFTKKIIASTENEDIKADVWFVVIPDEIYYYCRPNSILPKELVQTKRKIKKTSARKMLKTGMLSIFDSINKENEPFDFDAQFHNQLKARLLNKLIPTQILRESTLDWRNFVKSNGKYIRDFSKIEGHLAWSLSTAAFYKTGGRPWKLADIREGVCYVGLVYKKDERSGDPRNACCAAQMFLDSGDGTVFRGAVGPWYNSKTKEFHLRRPQAKQLISIAIETYKEKNGAYPKEFFIHARTRFNNDEWKGFSDAVPNSTNLVGIYITTKKQLKMYRTNSEFPILRGLAYLQSDISGFLWTKGFVPRLETSLALEVPNPLYIEISKGKADIKIVLKDILALTKLNYNACIYGDGIPVTLRFANAIGEILTASPIKESPPLAFKFYI